MQGFKSFQHSKFIPTTNFSFHLNWIQQFHQTLAFVAVVYCP